MPTQDLFSDSSLWASVLAVTPPPFFDPDAGFVFATDGAGVGDRRINFIGDVTDLPGTYYLQVNLTSNGEGVPLYMVLRYTVGGTAVVVPTQLGTGNSAPAEYTMVVSLPETITGFSWEIGKNVAGSYVAPLNMGATLLAQLETRNSPPVINGGGSDYNRVLCYNSPVDYNTGQFVDPRTKTLAQLRTELLRRMGYSAQAATPPAGMTELLTSYLQDAQEQLFERYPLLRLTQWFGWQTQVGQRFYDVPIDCTRYLDFRHVKWVGLQNDDQWFSLVAGINPILFNQTIPALPQYYELREFLELWPAPDKDTYIVWLKGDFGPQPFEADTDVCTVDARAVFLHALANAKAHEGQPDATRYDRQLEILIGRYTGGAHTTKRYVPGEPAPVAMTRPIREVPGG